MAVSGTTGGIARWSHAFVASSAVYLVAWRLAVLLGAPEQTTVLLAVLGFVCHVAFGMGYLLIPSYFGRVLETPRTPPIHLALAVPGAALLSLAPLPDVPSAAAPIGALVWALGVAVFLGSLAWTIRDDPFGSETGTAAVRDAHRWTDGYANRFVPVALAYLGVGTYASLARSIPLLGLTDVALPRIAHLLAAGFAALLVLSLGTRLAPRFLGVPAPRPLVAIVLPAGAVGPALIAMGLGGAGPVFEAGALAEATAICGFAATYAFLFSRSDRRRVGLWGVLFGVVAGVFGVVVGLSFAFSSITPAGVRAHRALVLSGFLGLSVVGFVFQFFPPSAGRVRWAGDRTAFAAIGLLALGLSCSVGGFLAGIPAAARIGSLCSLVGAVVYAALLVAVLSGVGPRRAGE